MLPLYQGKLIEAGYNPHRHREPKGCGVGNAMEYRIMGALDSLRFVRSAPVAEDKRKRSSPLEKARQKLIADIDRQIKLATNPNYEERKTVRKRKGGTVEKVHKPRSWVVSTKNGKSYINIRYSNKVLSIGGKRGSIIECATDEVVPTFEAVKAWAQSDEADRVLELALRGAKRKRRTA